MRNHATCCSRKPNQLHTWLIPGALKHDRKNCIIPQPASDQNLGSHSIGGQIAGITGIISHWCNRTPRFRGCEKKCQSIWQRGAIKMRAVLQTAREQVHYTEAKIGEEVEWPHRERERGVCECVRLYTHMRAGRNAGMRHVSKHMHFNSIMKLYQMGRKLLRQDNKRGSHTHTRLALASIERLGPGGRRGARGGEWGVGRAWGEARGATVRKCAPLPPRAARKQEINVHNEC